MGRKNLYTAKVEPFLNKIPEWYQDMTEAQIAAKLGVSTAAFESYKKAHEELQDTLDSAKKVLIDDLKQSLKKKAKGFTYKETKKTTREVDGKKNIILEEYERYSPPDTGAIHLLLKNLDDTWRNDDQATIDLKKQKLELERQKAENDNW